MSISGHKRTSPGLKLAAYTGGHWGKRVIESSGISRLDVWLKLEGELGPLSFRSFSSAVAVHMGALLCKDSPSAFPSAAVPCGFLPPA